MEQIKECPYCGSAIAVVFENIAYKEFVGYVKCDCGATGPDGRSEEDAILLWWR